MTPLRSLILWALLVGTCCADVVSRPVSVGTHQPSPALLTGWLELKPLKQVNYACKGLADIESRMPDGHIYRDGDLVTWAHETTHGINSRIRVQMGEGVNAFYCMEGNIGIFREPRVTKSNVCRYVPANLRGDVWGLYMVGQTSWDGTPLYILDEWVAYINGAMVALELDRMGQNQGRSTSHDIARSIEFAGYASALMACIDAHDPQYVDREKLAKFIAFNIDRSLWLARQGGSQQQVDAFAVAYVNGGSSACASGNCQSWSWGQGQWRPAPSANPKPSSPRPQPPAKPVPSTSPPPAGAAGCKCDSSTSACKCDKKPLRECACDKNELDALRKEIESLKVLIASGKLKGDKGDQGPKGDKGEPGTSAAGEKIILAIEQPDGKIVQATGIIGKKPNGKYDRFVLPLKPQPKKK